MKKIMDENNIKIVLFEGKEYEFYFDEDGCISEIVVGGIKVDYDDSLRDMSIEEFDDEVLVDIIMEMV